MHGTGPISRGALAADRARIALDALRECRFCAHECGVNRLAGDTGPCHAGVATRVFSAQTEVSDELELIPTFAIALSGCDLRCAFCITGGPSWNPRAGELLNVATMAERARSSIDRGARTVMILGGEPTVNLHSALQLVAALPDNASLVWKTNGHGTAIARNLLEGIFDFWVVDYKFGNDGCAQRLAGINNYQQIVRENLRWAVTHSELIVRHLVMPGHVECCWRPVARWLAFNLPNVKVNLQIGFWPAWQSQRHPELRRALSVDDKLAVQRIAEQFELRLVE